jgi:hypothetical protein
MAKSSGHRPASCSTQVEVTVMRLSVGAAVERAPAGAARQPELDEIAAAHLAGHAGIELKLAPSQSETSRD